MTEAIPAAVDALAVSWHEAVAGLADRGWVMHPDVVTDDALSAVDHDDRRQWRLLGDEGVVRQHACGAHLPVAEALPEVCSLAIALVAVLSAVAVRAGLPELPAFNEVTWGRYPAGVGGSAPTVTPTPMAALSLCSRCGARRRSGSSTASTSRQSGALAPVGWHFCGVGVGLVPTASAQCTRRCHRRWETGGS